MLGTELINRLADRYEVIAIDLAAGYGRRGVRWSLFHLCDRDALERCRFTQRPDAVVWCPELHGVEVGPSHRRHDLSASGDRPVVKEDPMLWVGATRLGDRPGADRHPARCAEHSIDA
jgi:dTDP-4-dehydrorhamnose reductase